MVRPLLTLLIGAAIAVPGAVRAEIPGPVETRSARSAELDLRAVVGVAVALDDHRLFFDHVHHRAHLPHLQVEISFLHRVSVELDYSLLWVDFAQEATDLEPVEGGFGSGDLRVRSRYTLLREGQWPPAIAIQLGVKLPNAGAREGYGTDETDLELGLLVSKALGPVDLHGSMALGILGNPMERAAQDDVFLGSFLVVVHPTSWLRFLAEIAGMPPSPVNQGRAVFRGGVGFRAGGIDVGVVAGVGMTPSSPRFVAGLDVGFHGPLRREPEGEGP
jgi:hypothetical protein